MNAFCSIFKRELKGYFSTPIAYVFLVIFLLAVMITTLGEGFFEAGQADLRIMFINIPKMLLLLVPGIAMRMWAEERRSNTIELLFTLPVTTCQAVLAKFFAAWTMLVIGLILTFPMVITVYYLGEPDVGPIVSGYVGCILLAGTYLAIGSFFSAMTRNQVIAFVLAVVACGVFFSLGMPMVLDFLANWVSSTIAEFAEIMSFQSRFESLQRGVLEIRDILLFVILTVGWLWANIVILEERKAA